MIAIKQHSIILQDFSQIFDPLGLATPVTIHAKISLQEVWQSKCTWAGFITEVIQIHFSIQEQQTLSFRTMVIHTLS